MAYKTPPEITLAAAEAGETKLALPPAKILVAGVLAGAYIAFGGLLAVVASAGLKPASAGNVPLIITGALFSVGLMLVVIAGAELATGNMATNLLPVLRGRAGIGQYTWTVLLALLGNLIGSLLVAYFLAVKSGVITAELPLARLEAIIKLKTGESDWQLFLRAIGCNWLVCLAVWLALGAQDIGGKILGIFFPIMAFVTLGFDHVVANMFFLPAAIFADVPGVGWGDALENWVFAFLGNVVGAGVFVAAAYWYLYRPAEEPGGPDVPGADEREMRRREPAGSR
jgi:formate transporter